MIYVCVCEMQRDRVSEEGDRTEACAGGIRGRPQGGDRQPAGEGTVQVGKQNFIS